MKMPKPHLLAAAAVASLAIAPTPATADDWSWSLTPYMWLSSVGADISINDQEIASSTVGVGDVLDDTDFAIMVHLEGQRGKHGLLLDVLYVDLGDDDRRVALPGPGAGTLVAKSDLEQTILDVGGIYNPRGDGTGFGLIYGARIVDVDQEIDARVEVGPITTRSKRIAASGTNYDGLVGVRYLGRLSERWLWNGRADFSTGGTEFTWSALAGFGRTFGEGGRHALLFGYRYLKIELDESDANAEVETRLNMDGPYFAIKFGF